METVEFRDIVARLHCPLAAQAGYEPKPPLPDRGLAREILTEWPSNSAPLKKVVSDRAGASKWLSRTRFGMSTGESYPGEAEGTHNYWTDGRIAHARIEIPGGKQVIAVSRLPYLHKISGSWEVVYCYVEKTPMDVRRRSDLITRAQWDQSIFRRMTGEPLFSRLLAPAYRHEEELAVPSTSASALVAQSEALRAAPVATPGLHCNDTEKTEKRSGYRWRCPVRENENCSAVEAFNAGNNAGLGS
jgi:hypothetical protein